jgi:uncharacterized protein involved in exopolysaccharide biosynthesis
MLDYGAEAKQSAAHARASNTDSVQPRSGFGVAQALALALRHKLFIAAVAFACAAAGFGLTKALTPRYLATAQIYLDPRGLPGVEKDAAAGQDSTGFINFVETQTRIITSQLVLERVVSAEKLTSDPEFDAPPSLLSRLLGRRAADGDPVAGAIRTLGSKIVVRRPERTFIIDISVSTNDPNKSARLANAVAQAYIDVRGTMHSDAAQQAATAFTSRLGGLRERLLGAEKQLEEYKAANGFVGTREAYIDEQSLKEINQQLTFARTRLEDARSRYMQAQRASRSDADVAAIASSLNLSTLTSLRSQQAEAQQKFADISADLGPRHPAVRNAAARVAETRRLVQAELGRLRSSLHKDYERARGTEEALQRDLERLQHKAVVSAQASVKLRDLEREVEVSRSIYESFLTRSRRTGEAQQLDDASMHIITMAAPPITRSFPPGAVFTSAVGFLGGLGLGFGFVLLRERGGWAARPEGEEAARPALASRRPESLAVTDATRFTVRDPVASRDALELTRLGIPFVRPFADRRELEAVVSRLSSLIGARERPLVVAFVGDAPGAIRTIMAVNVALALRLAQFEVALVDADETETALTALIEEGSSGLADSGEPYVETRDAVLLALPAIDDEPVGAVGRIIDGFRRGRPSRMDIVLCDGADEATLDKADWVVPVLGRDQDDESVAAELPEAALAKIALILRVDHSNPWLPRSEARRSA